MEIELVVFDMAGTTVYDGDAVNISLRSALARAGVDVTRDEVNEVMGIAKPIAIRDLLQRKTPADASPERVMRIHDDFLAEMLAYYRNDPAIREVPGASETFRRLQSAGIRVALDTGFSRPIADAILERLGWNEDGRIDVTVTVDEVANGRPHPDMIYYAMEKTGVQDVGKVAKVGDTPADLQEGRAADCALIVGVTAGSHTRAQLEPYPHTHLIATVADLPILILGEKITA